MYQQDSEIGLVSVERDGYGRDGIKCSGITTISLIKILLVIGEERPPGWYGSVPVALWEVSGLQALRQHYVDTLVLAAAD